MNNILHLVSLLRKGMFYQILDKRSYFLENNSDRKIQLRVENQDYEQINIIEEDEKKLRSIEEIGGK